MALDLPGLHARLIGARSTFRCAGVFRCDPRKRRIHFDSQDVSLLVSGAVAVLAALALAIANRSLLWGYAAACGLLVMALAASYIRFVVYAEAMAAMMLPIAVLAGFFLGPKLPACTAGSKRSAVDVMANCHVSDIAPALRTEGQVVVLTEINDAPEILWRTRVLIVGSFYHRSSGAYIRARNAWQSLPADGPRSVLATGATDILACDLTGRPPLVAGLPPVTLQDRLMRHDLPSWLHEVAHANGYHLYRIESRPSE